MTIPKEVKNTADKLSKAGFDVYLVGGCLRDLLLGREPKDWDLTTSAQPKEIQKLFPDSVYENKFGTVGVKVNRRPTRTEEPRTNAEKLSAESALSQRKSALDIVEVTTFRLEGKYTDKRHPDEIKFAKTVEEDLSRRDFTVNAIAAKFSNSNFQFSSLVDPFGGQEDLKNKIIRAVGDPARRFQEDALRLMRAIRFSAQLGFVIEPKTAKAIQAEAGLIEFVSKERIRDEFEKLLITNDAHEGVRNLQASGLLKKILPELEEGVGMEQNLHHIYTVFEHDVRSLEYAVKSDFPLDLRLASLLHDVGKPRVREWKNDPRGQKTFRGKKGDWTFYQHQHVGEKIVLEIMDRLRFPKDMTEKVALLVREHMFVYDPEIVTLKGVRRLVSRVGAENMDALMKIREADRIGSGVAKAQPYRLRYLQAMVEKVKQDPVSAKMLKVKGNDVMKELKIEPGPRVGAILAALLEEVLDDPKLNTEEHLLKRVKELGALSDQELAALGEKAKKSAAEVQSRIDEEIKKKYFVK